MNDPPTALVGFGSPTLPPCRPSMNAPPTPLVGLSRTHGECGRFSFFSSLLDGNAAHALALAAAGLRIGVLCLLWFGSERRASQADEYHRQRETRRGEHGVYQPRNALG